MKVLSFDIGGANTKFAVVSGEEVLERNSIYFPFWKRKNKFGDLLVDIIKKIEIDDIDAIGITMTAELSDAFQTKSEGVNFILKVLKNVLSKYNKEVYVLSNDLRLLSIEEAKQNPYKAASANYLAVPWYVSREIKNGILIDVGSTTTDIIPIRDGRIAARGKTDLERLQTGELIYTGILRTNVAAIVNSVPVNGKSTRVSSEYFSTTADVYSILGDIENNEYQCSTADGRGKSRNECMARLARVVCADTDMLSEKDITGIAKYIKERQIVQISDGIKQVMDAADFRGEVKIFVTGAGSFLAKTAAEQIGAVAVGIDINPSIALGYLIVFYK
ncbi:MAG: hypothetical protein A7316_08725 [Candidatus Altiarchaeales archaeon WOR_SM1_86-2]|nr:MAG: hypothetical protein A7316_08725 [Candidatus Altiarchaeales archaeon WOR_SM1_86-2]